MAHLSENSHRLIITEVCVRTPSELRLITKGLTDVCVIRLPACEISEEFSRPLSDVGQLIAGIAEGLGSEATLVVLGEVVDLVQIQDCMPASMQYQLWVTIKRTLAIASNLHHLPYGHFGVLVHTRYKQSLRHTKTRIEYTYCPVCDRTTKDYGGKKHTYHESGTLISDVWRDISGDLNGDIAPIIDRLADLFGVDPYRDLVILDCRAMPLQREFDKLPPITMQENDLPEDFRNQILNDDCLRALQKIPDNSIDFAFTDPPYNLGKKYLGYSDDLTIQDYFKWCDVWIDELSRILKPGRTLAILNIPLWATRHFLHMQQSLAFQNWIVWDALAFPVRLIMPAHYAIVCFSKGESRELPGLAGEISQIPLPSAPRTFHALKPMDDNYCLRENCVNVRLREHIDDRAPLTDIWADIHRLKHNSKRVDHPTQLPPHLLYRLITIFTKPNEVVLDCFNGSGTTTLTAHQLGRTYLGIEASEKYWSMAEERHSEIRLGLDPFRKEERVLTSKNSPVPRLAKQIYKIPKKTLQLEVKRIAKQLGHVPTRSELIEYGKYPIKFYDSYFTSWGEVTAAARTTGMTERRTKAVDQAANVVQLSLLEKSSGGMSSFV
jgi:site-specific DNA-methyltransferase (adenine-specific)